MLFVAADHQHWMFAVEGLAPAPDLQEYQLWFLVGERPVSGGTFRVETGRRVELSSPTMPAGTTAVAITLEPRGGMPRPTGPQVLFGDRLIEVL
jgi:anti-sigma-K factor RskA